jgi:hypothetical protein
VRTSRITENPEDNGSQLYMNSDSSRIHTNACCMLLAGCVIALNVFA